MSTKVITVILQFEQENAFTVARARFREHFTDVIRVMNANPNLGKLKSAHVALADTMNSIAPLEAGAYGAPRASLPKTWTRCDICTNDAACAANGGCILASRTVDKASNDLKKQLLQSVADAHAIPDEDKPPRARARFEKKPAKKVVKKTTKKTKKR